MDGRARKAMLVGLAAALAIVTSGCGAPVAPAPAQAEEERIKARKPASRPAAMSTPAPTPRPAAAGRATSASVAPTARPASPVASQPDVTAAPAAAGGLAVRAEPGEKLRLVPVRDAAGRLVDARFSPVDGKATWRLTAPAAGLLVSKVKVEVRAGTAVETVEATPAQLELPARLADEVALALPFALTTTLSTLEAAPDAARVQLAYTFYAADGVAVPGADGAPLTLRLTVDVL